MLLFCLEKKRKKGRAFFQEDWLKNPEYKDWVKRGKGSEKVFRVLCSKPIELSSLLNYSSLKRSYDRQKA